MRREDYEPKWARLLTAITAASFAVALLCYWLEH
jgi:hypothetical protein